MIDFSTWNLTVPAPTGSAPVIATPQLLHGYQSEYFHRNADGSGVVFWAPVNGSHTAHAHYPRSELRETSADGSLYNWKYPGATHTLSASLAVNQVPGSGKVVIGQIHGFNEEGENATPLIKLQYRFKKGQGGQLEALVRNQPDDDSSPASKLLTGVPLDARFSYVIQLTGEGRLQVDVTDSDGKTAQAVFEVGSSWAAEAMYFKAGAYVQDNKGGAEDGGRVTFYEAQVRHVAGG